MFRPLPETAVSVETSGSVRATNSVTGASMRIVSPSASRSENLWLNVSVAATGPTRE